MTDKPAKFGAQWTDTERKALFDLFNCDTDFNTSINTASHTLQRTPGGIRCEISKRIKFLYDTNHNAEQILQLTSFDYNFIKGVIKKYKSDKFEAELLDLERQNKLLRLRLEKMQLQSQIDSITRIE